MKLAAWNVNSIKARLPVVTEWLAGARPDALCMQETKCTDDAFPVEPFEKAGYQVFFHGQKSYNGVAIAVKIPAEDVLYGLPGADTETFGARYMELTLFPDGSAPVRVASIYLPNGNPVSSDKFKRKLKWMSLLRERAAELLKEEEAFVLGGDFNIIPSPMDAKDIAAWKEDALYHPEALSHFRALTNLGIQDAFRACWQEGGRYSFWDYQAGAWRKGDGIRIDHMLVSPQAMDRLRTCDIDSEPRGWDKPSDHAPIWVELK
ncbi:MAG: exodeoxyribonuclease III [Hyphomicrobiales bacterium]|nr:exodeoxyribonuclease III [Hyphomicrobiales bacterium]MCY4039275.1 exodeoxyribonuclease III [Hyphomicrobiales bacterium]